MPNLKKEKEDKIIDERFGMVDLESYIKKKKSQNRVLGKLLNNLNSEHIKKTKK